jgi:photosystem II stability/assembly factor-like uncharacterized protein
MRTRPRDAHLQPQPRPVIERGHVPTPRSSQRRREARAGIADPAKRPGRGRRWLALGIAVGVVAIALVVAFGPGGLTRPRPISILQTTDFHALAFNPTDPNIGYFGHHNGVLRSVDGGRNWSPLIDQPEIDAMGFAFARDGSGRMVIAGHTGLRASTDGGTSWAEIATNLPSSDIRALAMHPDEPNALHAFVVGRGLFASADGGETWNRLEGNLPFDVMALASAGGTPERLFLATARDGLFRSVDGGITWATIPTGPSPGPVFSLAAELRNGAVYAGASDGLFRSTDGGETWQKLGYPGKNALSVAVSPSQPGALLAISMEERRGLLYRSEDGGSSWMR